MDGKLFIQILVPLLFSYREELDNFLCKNTFFHPLYEADQLCLFSGKMFFSCKLLTHQIRKLRVIFFAEGKCIWAYVWAKKRKSENIFPRKTNTHTQIVVPEQHCTEIERGGSCALIPRVLLKLLSIHYQISLPKWVSCLALIAW